MNQFRKFMLYFYTLSSLKLVQLFGRFFCSRLSTVSEVIPRYGVVPFSKEIPFFLTKNHTQISGDLIEVLNTQIKYTEGWYPKFDTLIIYNLHYFNYINSSESQLNDSQYAITHWIANVPGQSDLAWNPYVVSIRIINWIKWLVKHQIRDSIILDSLYIQCRYLRKNNEFHLLGNHYFENAKALYMAGIFFNSSEAEEWGQWSEKVLSQQIEEQILDDGAHFERSPMYHSIMLENVYDILSFSQYIDHSRALNEKMRDKSVGMFTWLKSVAHKDGVVPKFNDCSVLFAPSIDELILFAEKLNLNCVSKETNCLRVFEPSGFLSFNNELYKAIVDFGMIGPRYLKGHGHSENFSLELSVNGKRLFVNHGVSTYQEGSQREFERSSLAHNTVSVNGKNSNEVWKSFRVGRTSNVTNIQHSSDSDYAVFSATQNGFEKIFSGPLHTRSFKFTKDMLLIEDVFKKSKSFCGNIVINFYINNGWDVELKDDLVIIKNSEYLCIMKPPLFSTATVEKTTIYDSWYYPVNGWKISFFSELKNCSHFLTEIRITNENN